MKTRLFMWKSSFWLQERPASSKHLCEGKSCGFLMLLEPKGFTGGIRLSEGFSSLSGLTGKVKGLMENVPFFSAGVLALAYLQIKVVSAKATPLLCLRNVPISRMLEKLA